MQKQENIEIPPQYQEMTYRFMQISGMSMNQSYSFLKFSEFNIDMATHNLFQPPSFPKNLNNYNLSNINKYSFLNNISESPQKYKKRNNYKSKQELNAQRKNYEKTYLIKKKIVKNKNNRKKKLSKNQQQQKIIQEFDFSKQLLKFIQQQIYVKFQSDIYQIFQKIWDDKSKLIAIHCIRFIQSTEIKPPYTNQILQYTKKIYTNPIFVQTFNKYFVNFGIDPKFFDFEHYPFLKQMISEKDQFSVVILRYDEKDQKIKILKKLPFSQSFKLSCPEEFIKISQNLLTQHNSLKNRQISEEQIRKLEQDRKIRQQQQDEYYKQLLNCQRQKLTEQQIIKKQQPLIKIDIFQERKKIRQSMRKYSNDIDNPINIKIRLPNSEHLMLKLPRNQCLQYIFKAIQGHQKQQLGFQDENARQFDIILPYERVSLGQKKSKTLEQIFGNSDYQTLVVKQL